MVGGLWLLVRDLGAARVRLLLALSVVGCTFARVASRLVVVVPAGAGARAAVLVVVLGPALNPSAAPLISVVPRD
jgi:hypothetical protein